MTLHFLPTRLMNTSRARSNLPIVPNFALPAKLMFSNSVKPDRLSTSTRNIESVIVRPEELPIVAFVACPPPKAPIDSVFRCGWHGIVAIKVVPDIGVEVSDSFPKGGAVSGSERVAGCLTRVKEMSRRRREGHIEMIGFSDISVSDVPLSFRVCKDGSCVSTSKPASSFAKAVSVSRIVKSDAKSCTIVRRANPVRYSCDLQHFDLLPARLNEWDQGQRGHGCVVHIE